MTTSSSSTSITSSSTSPTITSTLSPSPYAINVANIKNLIPLTLDLQASNYSKWRTLVLVTLRKFGLRHHIDGSEPQHDDSDWVQQDFTVLSWLYGTISMEILDIVMQVDATAFTVWTSIENLFRDNKRSRALQLEADFRNTIQGDLSISDYCHQLKTLADALVLTTLRGLNENFATLATILPMQSPFSSFIQTSSLLLLEDNRRINTSKQASATALLSANCNNVHHGAANNNNFNRGDRGDRGHRVSNSTRGGRGGRGRNRDSRSGRWNERGSASNTTSSWAPIFNPWMGVIQAWPAPWSGLQRPSGGPGVLGSRPQGPPHQAFTTFAPLHQPVHLQYLSRPSPPRNPFGINQHL